MDDAHKLHDSLYRSGVEVLHPFVTEASQGDGTDASGRSQDERLAAVRRGCEILERVVSINPQNWNALWVMGTAWRAVDRWSEAYSAYKRAFDINKNVHVARDLSGVCVQAGRRQEAVEIARYALSLEPNDPTLVANLGYVLLGCGDVEGAAKEVARALKMDPSDPITQNLWAFVNEQRARIR